jgi:anti-sigma factor RsiW
MKPIESAELSAFLDCELDADRACEVQTALEGSPELRAEFDALSAMDAEWRSAAGRSAFEPKVVLPSNPAPVESWLITAATVAGLVAIRMIPKFGGSIEFGFVLHVLALALLMVWLISDALRIPVRSAYHR